MINIFYFESSDKSPCLDRQWIAYPLNDAPALVLNAYSLVLDELPAPITFNAAGYESRAEFVRQASSALFSKNYNLVAVRFKFVSIDGVEIETHTRNNSGHWRNR